MVEDRTRRELRSHMDGRARTSERGPRGHFPTDQTPDTPTRTSSRPTCMHYPNSNVSPTLLSVSCPRTYTTHNKGTLLYVYVSHSLAQLATNGSC